MVRWMSFLIVGLVLVGDPRSTGAAMAVNNADELRRVLSEAEPGTVISLAPGEYGNGHSFDSLKGAPNAPIVIRAADPKRPPTFTGGSLAIHFRDCSHVTLQGISVRGARGNGLNFDDGGTPDTPSHHITLEDVSISEIGPRGNTDGLKVSGITDVTVRRCRIEGWGGSAIDMVGCKRVLITDCRFTGREGFSQDNAVQAKGGSSDVTVQASLFDRAGQRAINIGGSTGLEFFRPKFDGFEARRVTVAGNRFVGSMAPIAWVSADGGRVVRNTIQFPERWVARILQEQTAPGFQPCRGGVFEENLVVYDRRVVATVNVGPNTAPESFTFRRNAWFQTDGAARPQLPVAETEGVVQVDPRLDKAGAVGSKVTAADPRLKGIGADEWDPLRK